MEEPSTTDGAVHREADRLLLARFAPASLLIDDALNILQFRGETGPYLEHASGPSSLNLNRVARPELLVEIIPAIREARESGSEARREGLSLDGREGLSIEVIPLRSQSPDRSYLILFGSDSGPRSDRRAPQPSAVALPESQKDRRLAQLEREIATLRDYLQSSTEAHEAVQEELRSANEEAQSANEEFQSTNEELETAKEELQSSNEELITTNEELRSRNRELVTLNSEVHQLKETAERARTYAEAIIESVREPLLVMDRDLRILRANRAFYSMFEDQAGRVLGRRLQQLGAGEWNLPDLLGRLSLVLAQDRPLSNWEVTLAFPGIGTATISLSARKIPGDAEREDFILLGIDDITEIRARLEHLREDGERKDTFLAMLSHELRSPLAPIAHALHLLRAGKVEASTASLYGMMDRQVKKLAQLVDQLLDVARLGHDLFVLDRHPVDLSAIVRQAAEAARSHIEENRHELALTLPNAPLFVDADALRMDQVVSNLLDNAIKYTGAGGRISLSLTQEASEAVLRVRDDGIGLAPEMQQKIFELFAQADESLARTAGGLGIGLTLVRRILELHGGGVEARSAGLGMGSEFIVRLPALVPPAQDMAQTGTRSETRSAAPPASSQRVLIVDDHKDSADSMAALVSSWGHKVAVARDGAEALRTGREFKPDIAFIDIGLPGIDGYELARSFRRDPVCRKSYLVALTGYGRTEDTDAARAAGFDRHWVKPADLDAMRRLIDDPAARSRS